jgi:prolyl 4-hydroxylase
VFDSELRRLADAGSPEHQWKLSVAYRELKREARASRYFRKALAQGYPEAIEYQLGQWTAQAGEYASFAAAQNLLDEYPGVEGLAAWRWRLGVIGGLLSTEDEVALVAEQLMHQNPEALRYVALRCAVAGKDAQARSLLQQAVASGDPVSARILETGALNDVPAPFSESDSLGAKETNGWESAFSTAVETQRKDLATDPKVYLCRSWLPALACRILAIIAERELQPSLTYDPHSGRQIESDYRTSHSMTFMPWLIDPSVAYIQRSLALHCGMSAHQCEVLGLLRYKPGQEYKLHYDAFSPEQTGAGDILRDGGQRTRTALVYLNDGYVGGETRMENLDLEIKGSAGDLLVFDNVDEAGQRHSDSLHAGKPVTAGNKWLLSQWFRETETLFTRQMGWK